MTLADLTIGLRYDSPEEVATIIRARFGHSFVPRTSSYLGGHYYLAVNGSEEVLVYANRDGKEVAEADFSEFNVLLQVNSCRDTTLWKRFTQELNGVLIREVPYNS